VRTPPRGFAFSFTALALAVVTVGVTARAEAQDAPPTPPIPEGTVIPVTVAPEGVVGEAIIPPAGYETLIVEPPPPPAGYGAYSLAPAPAARVPPAPSPASGGDRTLRILAESGAWLLATVATFGVSALVANATDPVEDPSPLLLSFFTGYFVLMPIATWLGGNAVGGEGSLGWTIFGHALFGLIGAVVAYEMSHGDAVERAQSATAVARAGQAPGLSLSFSF
jgi:hypothetical protein